MNLRLRSITDQDREFLFQVYASTRVEEMALTSWNPDQIHTFLASQFQLQHAHYVQHYKGADFLIIEENQVPIGRLYIHRGSHETRIIDLSLLPDYRGAGIGRQLMNDLAAEADQNQTTLSLHVEQMNPIRPFYKRLGFFEVELRGIYLFMQREPRSVGPIHPSTPHSYQNIIGRDLS